MFKERSLTALAGIPMLLLFLVTLFGGVGLIITAAVQEAPLFAILGLAALIGSVFGFTGLFVVNPNEAAVLQLFGDYKGTVRREGMAWANPFLTKKRVSTKVRSFESQKLKVLNQAGVEITDARISHLAYAPEIAQAMLQRQQAGAIIAARSRIVEGAVGMVEMALELLEKNQKVHLDEERKAAMVSNLLVVLCGERGTQPVVNTGTLYH